MRYSLVCLFFALAPLVYGGSCKELGILNQREYNETALIFQAEVLSKKYDSVNYSYVYEMFVGTVFKGDIDTGYLRVYSSGSFTQSNLKKGEKLLLFIDYYLNKPSINLCDRQYVIPSFSKIPHLFELYSLMKKKDGYYEDYYATKIIRSEGEIKNGLPVGEWKYYDTNGKLEEYGSYLNGMREGIWTSFANGYLIKQEYKNGKKQGFFQEYYASGQIRSEGKYLDEYKSGVWTYYYTNGKRKEQLIWELGKIKSFWNMWDPTGKQWLNDGNGIIKHYDDNGKLIEITDSTVKNGKL